jgi:beta-galactosidase
MWHVHNEYGTWCFCDHCAAAFRRWLQRRYNDLTSLNEAWTTAFWGQRYGRWEEILPPRATQYLPNPAQDLDYRRFLSDSLLAAYTEQREVLKKANAAIPVTTNFVLAPWVPVDHARWAREVDLVAIDHYPSTPEHALAESAFAADMARGWAGWRPWLLMEHAPTPGLMAPIALTHIARGSQGALYFQWRASRGGAEQWHPALVPHTGTLSAETVSLGALLSRLPTAYEATPAQVALWYDEESWWAWQAPHLRAPVDYQAIVQRCHAALERRGYAVDVLPPESLCGGDGRPPHRLVVVPAAYLMTEPAAHALRRHIEGGGHLLTIGACGVVDEHARVRLGTPLFPDSHPADLPDTALEDLLSTACADAGVKPNAEGLPPGTRAVHSRGAQWLFHPDGTVDLNGTRLT